MFLMDRLLGDKGTRLIDGFSYLDLINT